MAKGGGGGDREGGALKTALVVAGGLVLAWLTVETAFKPFLDGIRGSSPARPTRPDDAPAESSSSRRKGEANVVGLDETQLFNFVRFSKPSHP
ncbi:hypothetical protein ACMD2_22955 [Ananas comosus]|uniref:Outer envelope membrane protein 7 n=1 Tax=Ananas comosus TaxID=4615 RepID=A0A199V8L3_ANACO|nr:hypothetical protein ACMD2_22955 [Ananas comosus]